MNYQIIKRHGKALCGSRLFASANTAEERRGFRTARRRLDRRNWRINILQELFAEEISKVDSGVFYLQDEGKQKCCSRRSKGQFWKMSWTSMWRCLWIKIIQHRVLAQGNTRRIINLRKMLMETEKVPDIRLVYLVIHHMMKHRGHFLLSGDIESSYRI